jgi:hypothetical protein
MYAAVFTYLILETHSVPFARQIDAKDHTIKNSITSFDHDRHLHQEPSTTQIKRNQQSLRSYYSLCEDCNDTDAENYYQYENTELHSPAVEVQNNTPAVTEQDIDEAFEYVNDNTGENDWEITAIDDDWDFATEDDLLLNETNTERDSSSFAIEGIIRIQQL